MDKKKTKNKNHNKKKHSASNQLAKFRGWVQAGATLLTNIHLPNFFKGEIYQGNGKAVCVPGLNCYSCPAASGACPIGSFQAVVGSSKYKFSYYITGFLILLGVLLGRFICGFLCPFGWLQDLLHKVPTKKFSTKKLNIYAIRRGEYAPLIVTKAVNWFADYVYALRNALFHEIISPLDEEWQGIFKSAYLLLKQVSDICISCISQIEGFSQTQENAIFEYAEKHKSEYFDSLAEYVELLDFPKMVLSDWKIEKGKIILKGWFSARLKLQQGDAEDIENGTGFIREEEKGFDFSATLGDDFKIAKDKETQKECVEIKLQGI